MPRTHLQKVTLQQGRYPTPMATTSTNDRNYKTLARTGGFYLVTLLFVGMALSFIGFLVQWGVEAWYSTAFGEHRIHQIVDGAIMGAIIIGVAVQLYKPAKRVAALQTSLVVLIVFAAFSIAGGGSVIESMTFVVLGAVIALLHPARGELLPTVSRATISPRLAGLAVLAALPFAAFAVHQFGLQLTLVDDHAAIGHWGNMAGFAVSVVLLGVLASLKPRWWLFPAVTAGIFAVDHGLASIIFDAPSSVGPLWGGLELLWGLAFLAIAVLEYTGTLSTRLAPATPSTKSVE